MAETNPAQLAAAAARLRGPQNKCVGRLQTPREREAAVPVSDWVLLVGWGRNKPGEGIGKVVYLRRICSRISAQAV